MAQGKYNNRKSVYRLETLSNNSKIIPKSTIKKPMRATRKKKKKKRNNDNKKEKHSVVIERRS